MSLEVSLDLLPALTARNALDRPGDAAVIDGERSWTWAALAARAGAVAAGLSRAGLVEGATVALLTPASAPAVAFLHGAAIAGVVTAPLNERLAEPELRAFVEESGARLVVCDATWADVAGRLGAPVVDLATLIDGPTAEPIRLLDPAVGPDDPGAPAVVVATSGTTGRPKAAVLTHGQLSSSAAAWRAVLPPATGWLAALSFAHVAGLGIVWRAAAEGAPVRVARDADPATLLALLSSSSPAASHVSVVATQLRRLLDASGDAPAPVSLRAVLLGGGPVPAGLVTRALAAGWPVVPTYGMTETASGVTALSTADAAARPWSAGRALPGVELRIAGPDASGIGEIEVAGPMLFDGYLGRPEETAAARTPDGRFRTGDLGSLDADGYLTVHDRRLDLIVSGGENVYPAEVEAVLLEHPAIVDAGVAGRPDDIWASVPVAGVVVRPGRAVEDAELLAFCRSQLAAFKVPAAIVRVAEIPRTGSGKIRREALRSILGLDGTAAGPGADEVQAPANPGEGATWPGRATDDPVATRPSTRRQRLPAPTWLERPDGARLAYRVLARPEGPAGPFVLLLHATLSSSEQLASLARLIAPRATVLLLDRRGSGLSHVATPSPVPVSVHAADALALLDRERVDRAFLVGHSFGGVVGLALVTSAPDRVRGLVVYEPPLVSAAPRGELGRVADVPELVRAAHRDAGAPAATEAFLRAIGGDAAFDGLPPSRRAGLLAEGDGVLADVGTDPGDPSVSRGALARIAVPVTIVTGGASEPFYRRIAAALREQIRGSRIMELADALHVAPITSPDALAAIVRAGLDETETIQGGEA